MYHTRKYTWSSIYYSKFAEANSKVSLPHWIYYTYWRTEIEWASPNSKWRCYRRCSDTLYVRFVLPTHILFFPKSNNYIRKKATRLHNCTTTSFSIDKRYASSKSTFETTPLLLILHSWDPLAKVDLYLLLDYILLEPASVLHQQKIWVCAPLKIS